LVWKDVADTRAAMDDLSKNWTNPKNVGIGHSSCLLAQRPSMGVMLGAQREARDGLRLPRDVLSACLSGWPLHPRAMLLLGGTQHGST
jgi:hypothetical protein